MSEELKIFSVTTQIHSAEPQTRYVGQELLFPPMNLKAKVKKIIVQTLQTSTDSQQDYFVGFSEDRDVLFEWLRSGCNAEYYPIF